MSKVANPLFEELAKQASLLPQEKLQAIKENKNSLSIGIPKEKTFQENRIPLSPMAVQLLVQNGHRVLVETGSGNNANFSDISYSQMGCEITPDAKSIYNCDIILKVGLPTEDEVQLFKPKQILISAIQLIKTKHSIIRQLMDKGVTAIGYEFLKDDGGGMPIIRAMSEIAGRASVLIAAEYLSHYNTGKGELFGGIAGVQPTQIVIIGAGSVGQHACQTALGLGANVKVFDNSIYKLRRLEQLVGARVHSSTIIPSILRSALESCDVAIGALRSPFGLSPCVVSEAMVEGMRDKSIVVDVSIDQGGCFETSEPTNHKMPVFEKYGVMHYCVPNINSRFARTSSYALSNIFAPMLQEIADEGGIEECLRKHEGLRSGAYIYNGKLTNDILSNKFDLPKSEIEFLLAGLT
jgi:alanine dehydrogenase